MSTFSLLPDTIRRTRSSEPRAFGNGSAAPHAAAFEEEIVDDVPEQKPLDEVPELLRRSNAGRASNVFERDPSGVAAEQFRLMQRRLTNLRPLGSSMLLTSPGSGEGKSFNAHNLAWALAEFGHDTLLLELDLRRPTQTSYIGAEPSITIADVLSGKSAPDEALSRIGSVPLFFLGLPHAASNPTALLRSKELPALMKWAQQRFKWIVVDGPPVLPVADVEELLPSVDLVLLVARERLTPAASLQRAAERLGKRLNFVIYNDVKVSTAYGYGYR
jgi:Mrp family chromosome partitioning ATPase